MTNLKNEKELLKLYGKVIDYSEFQEDEIKEQPIQGFTYRLMCLIKESEIGKFTTYINNQYGTILLRDSTQYRTSALNFKKKHKNYLEVELNVEEKHFVPDNILRDDILFFFNIKEENKFFIVIKDEYIKQLLASEHFIVGMIDIIKAKDLFLQKDNIIKSKMKNFQIEINKLSVKYKDILFITISDSVIIKYSFQIISENGKFLPDKLDFNRIIKLFKEIRKITRKIFTMDIYGIFCYGMNKCKTIKSNSSNVFHAGIFSREFEKIFEIEKICKNLKKDKQGDLYMTNNLYHAYRHYVKKNWKQSSVEQSAAEWGINKIDIDVTKEIRGISEQDITVSQIPDESIVFSKN